MSGREKQGPCYEDFAVGDVIGSPDSYEVTAERLRDFAAEFDPQPIHLDELAARDGFFGEMTASGWHTLSATMGLLVRSPLFASGQVIGVGVDKLRWLRPVRPGDRLTARAEITGARPSQSRPGHGYLFVRVTTHVEGVDQPVASQQWTVLIPRMSAS